MNKYRITNPNNKEVRECKSRTTDNFAFGFDMDLYSIIGFTEFSLALSYTFQLSEKFKGQK